jgi:lysophospholipase L1-like esterase
VVVFGDSFVAGVGDPEGRGWVGRVVAASFAAGLPLTAYPLGVRRETSEQVAARLVAEAGPRLEGADAAGVVLSVGANDATEEDGAVRVAPERTVAALGAMLDAARGLGAAVLVVGPPPANDDAQVARIVALSAVLGAHCAQAGVPFVPVAEALRDDGTWRREAQAGDGAHPGAGGYARLAELVLAGGWTDWLARL